MSEMLYEGRRVCLSRHAGPASEGPDRRRYQLTIIGLPQSGDDTATIAGACVSLTRAELREAVQALSVIDATEEAP